MRAFGSPPTRVGGFCKNCGGGTLGGKKLLKRVAGFIGFLDSYNVASRAVCSVVEDDVGTISTGIRIGGLGTITELTTQVGQRFLATRVDSGTATGFGGISGTTGVTGGASGGTPTG